VLGIAIDISSRLKAEEELRSSERKYKLLFDSNPQPLSMIAKDDLSIIAVNDATANLYGYSKDELLTASAAIFRPSEDLEKQLEIFQQEISGSTAIGVVRHVRKDGAIMFVHIIAHDIIFEGRAVRLSLTTDVTEKIKAEEKLQKSEANLKTIMDTTDTAYALLDSDLNVMAFNQMAVKFVNSQYNHAPAKGDQLGDYFPRERFPQFLSYADEVLKGKNISYEINYPQPDGSVCWFYVRLFPITNDKKEIFGMMLALSDISERKNAEESLKAAYQLVQDHIDSIKEMAWKQSHLIRSPLANLKGLAAMLKDDPADTDVLDHIQNELDRMDSIIIEMAEDASNHDI
jgi:PAS domain S-box-containing protein